MIADFEIFALNILPIAHKIKLQCNVKYYPIRLILIRRINNMNRLTILMEKLQRPCCFLTEKLQYDAYMSSKEMND